MRSDYAFENYTIISHQDDQDCLPVVFDSVRDLRHLDSRGDCVFRSHKELCRRSLCAKGSKTRTAGGRASCLFFKIV
ncbi:MAG TPA: hypothetical protein DIT97_34000 [Gimesia maris]|uniref:Uncharacterized protein n=1 Tax=Gimesia maris TaxID=122 RepID=A0A3D3RG22_9PLAN|nr:hypothetical protein [Gimesia maris]